MTDALMPSGSSTPPHLAEGRADLDMLLRDALPEIKLALGEMIDRENARSLPARYAKLLPETLLVVTLRPDAAQALTPVAREVERELTDSCTRHGSLYDRAYRVQLRRAADPDAPLFAVSAHAGQDLAEPSAEEEQRTQVSPTELPESDPDTTRVDGFAGPDGWEPGQWVLVIENDAGEDREVFRLTDPSTLVGRRSDDPLLRSTIAIGDAPHVSRRQLALVWEPRDGAAGFQVYNLGLNPLHLPSETVKGARLGRRPLRLDELAPGHSGWVSPEMPIRIGEHGPTLRVEEVPESVVEDPDATVYE